MRNKVWLLPALLLALLTQPAAARARDEVMAGVFRCAVIGDMRLWLDCYYGAAQPMRAELNMPPVPAAQAHLALAPPAGEVAGGMSVRYQVAAGALRCDGLSDDRAWLNCYYGAAQPARAQLGLSPAPQARAQPSLPQGAPAATVPIPSHTVDPGWSQMVAYRFNHYGIFTVTLANGQVWRQLPGDTDFAHWTKPAASYAVRISRGALGSLNLKIKGGAQAFKVEQAN